MGNIIPDSWTTTYKDQVEILKSIIINSKGLSLMIEVDGKIVGIVETHLNKTKELKAPSIHIMIGDITARNKGVGYLAQLQQIELLKKKGYSKLYSRAQIKNIGSNKLLQKIGFTKDGDVYITPDGLVYQNYLSILKTGA